MVKSSSISLRSEGNRLSGLRSTIGDLLARVLGLDRKSLSVTSTEGHLSEAQLKTFFNPEGCFIINTHYVISAT